jgi:arylsulfatase A
MAELLRWLLAVAVAVLAVGSAAAAETVRPPNIVLILADDLGYGDPGCFNARSKIATPHIDALARDGMRFTDAHAAGAVCVPSRYGLLTGRYPYRNKGNRNPSNGPLIEKDRVTLASLLRDKGYTTAMVGKWHLGFEGGIRFDYDKPLRGGPADHGFDSFFGQHASLDIPPYFLIDNDRAVAPASKTVAASSTPGWSPVQGAFWREGAIAPGFKHEEVLPTYTRKAVEFLERRGKGGGGKPFFLYLAFTAPHTPWLPREPFREKSKAGLYGDFVADFDDSVGQVLAALKRAGLADDTLVVFTSDNGPVWYPADVEKYGHAAAGPLRGMKGDAWEGGHRMPFVARWPGKVKAGSTCDETICFTDLLATFAALVDAKLPDDAGEDSYNLLPLLRGEKRDGPLREATVVESSRGMLTIRQGEWKLIPKLGSGGFSAPATEAPREGGPAGQLYNLKDDLAETKNLYAEKPEVVQRLAGLLEQYQKKGRSAPR